MLCLGEWVVDIVDIVVGIVGIGAAVGSGRDVRCCGCGLGKVVVVWCVDSR